MIGRSVVGEGGCGGSDWEIGCRGGSVMGWGMGGESKLVTCIALCFYFFFLRYFYVISIDRNWERCLRPHCLEFGELGEVMEKVRICDRSGCLRGAYFDSITTSSPYPPLFITPGDTEYSTPTTPTILTLLDTHHALCPEIVYLCSLPRHPRSQLACRMETPRGRPGGRAGL